MYHLFYFSVAHFSLFVNPCSQFSFLWFNKFFTHAFVLLPLFNSSLTLHDAIVANKASEPKSERVTIAGRCCETGDMIGENMPLQHCEPGDIIAVCATGAYNYSMSSNYNRLCKPAVVFVNSGSDRLAVRRQTLDDIISNDIWLKQ